MGLSMASLLLAMSGGEESFLEATCGYVLTQPPRSASPLRYGEEFPIFLRSIGDCASIEYLADIAALEWARHAARYAPPAAMSPLELPQRSGGTAPCCPRGAASLGIAHRFAVPYRDHMGSQSIKRRGCHWLLETRAGARSKTIPFCRSPAPAAGRQCVSPSLARRGDDRGCRRSGLFSRTKLRLRRKRETAR